MNQIRFLALDNSNEVVAETGWLPEQTSRDAPDALAAFRRRFPDDPYSYKIERRGDSRDPNPVKLWRYQIKRGEEVYYSRPVQEFEKSDILAQLRDTFSGAEIREVQING